MRPTTPQKAAGWRMEPPVSEPSAATAVPAATTAADPPDEPPGTGGRARGMCPGRYAEFSFDEPMANSSQFVLPRMIAPASSSRWTAVQLYGGRKFSRIFDPAVVRRSLVTITSLIAIGTPASGGSGSPA